MATLVLNRPDVFPPGTVVGAYPAASQGRGTALESQTVGSDGTAAFTTLAANTPYVFTSAGGGRVRQQSSSFAGRYVTQQELQAAVGASQGLGGIGSGGLLGVVAPTADFTLPNASTVVPGTVCTVTTDGGPVHVEASLPFIQKDGTASYVIAFLVMDSSGIQTTNTLDTGVASYIANGYAPLRLSQTITPSAGDHTFKVIASCGSGSANVQGNPVNGVFPYLEVTSR